LRQQVRRPVGHEDGEIDRGNRPQYYSEGSPQAQHSETLLGAGPVTVDDRKHRRQQEECYRQAQP
jgi:hypothetical protein